MKEEIADDIELLIEVARSDREGGTKEVYAAAERVEEWLATYDPRRNN